MKICPKCGKQFPDDANFCPVDAARLSAAEVAPAAAAADDFDQRFELQARLGGATTGPVWKALDRTTGKVVALKLVAPEVTALPSINAKIERELRQLERVESAGIARVLASGRKGEQIWVATEYLDGAQTLAQAIGARGPIDAASAGRLVEMIGEALIEAAKAGVVHRDLAPKNVLFAGDQVRLINFCVPVAGPGADKCPGVPEYVAPECVEGKALDQRSNIYSLGAIHYYALTSQAPIDGDAASVFRAKIEGTIPPPSGRGVPVAADVDALVKRALDRSPSKRYLTVRQYLDEIVRVATGTPEAGSTLPAGSRSRPQAAELVRTLTGLPAGFGAAPAPAQALDAAVRAAQAGQVVVSPASEPPTGPVVELGAPKAASAGGTLQLGGSQPVAAPTPVAASPLAAAAAAAGVDATAPLGNAAIAAPAAPAAPVVATAPLASPVMPAGPILSSPAALAAAAAASGKKKGDDDGGSKGKFRETLWFKKGELDVAAAEAAAAAAAAGKEAGADKADSRPMEDRYNDDGTISRADRDKYSLKTGGTQMMPAIRDPGTADASGKVSERELVGEMKSGRTGVVIGILVALAVVGGLIAWLASR